MDEFDDEYEDEFDEDEDDDESGAVDAKERELKSAGEKQGPKTLEEKLEENFLFIQLAESEAKMNVLLTQLKNTPAAKTPLVLTPIQSTMLKRAESLVEDKQCKILHPIKTNRIKRLIRQIKQRVLVLKASFWTQKLGPILPYVGIALLILLLIIVIVVVIVAVVSFFQSETDPANMGVNDHITDEYFYGLRTVYIDESALMDSLQASYKQYVIDIVENIEENNPSIDITISIPTLNEDESITNTTEVDQHIENISLALANIVATGSTDYSNIDFASLYSQIPHFGFTEEQGKSSVDFIKDYIYDNSLYSSQDPVDIKDVVETTVTTDEDLQYIYNRSEKVMIKDLIATSAGISGLEVGQYIASIYMPNKDIEIESANYIIASEAEEFNATSKLIEENNGTENVLREKETTDNRDIISGFSAGSVTINKFTSIDENNLNAFSGGLSLFAALRLSPTYKNYFTLTAEGVYTWKPTSESLYYLTFEAETPFIFTDFTLNVKIA